MKSTELRKQKLDVDKFLRSSDRDRSMVEVLPFRSPEFMFEWDPEFVAGQIVRSIEEELFDGKKPGRHLQK